MKPLHTLLVATLFIFPAEFALAFGVCETVSENPNELKHQIAEVAIERAPVKYHALVRETQLVMKGVGERLIPFAVDRQGPKTIVFPPAFAKVMCKIALATYLSLEGIQESDFAQAAKAAGNCFEVGHPQLKCLIGFSNDLAKRYEMAFSEQYDGHRQVAFNLYEFALRQVTMHEYAHHFLDHFNRVKAQTINRIDAELKADYWAITNGVQAGDPVSAMYYFFNGLADIELYTDKLIST